MVGVYKSIQSGADFDNSDGSDSDGAGDDDGDGMDST